MCAHIYVTKRAILRIYVNISTRDAFLFFFAFGGGHHPNSSYDPSAHLSYDDISIYLTQELFKYA